MQNQQLDPNQELEEEELETLIELFEKYPREPKGQELKRMQEAKRRARLTARLQKMFQLEED